VQVVEGGPGSHVASEAAAQMRVNTEQSQVQGSQQLITGRQGASLVYQVVGQTLSLLLSGCCAYRVAQAGVTAAAL
jgi:hypothetical protein